VITRGWEGSESGAIEKGPIMDAKT
jgi:hypothetical protein